MAYRRSRRQRFTRCVTSVTARQGSETSPYNAFAVCRSSTGYKGTSRNIGIREYERKVDKEIREHPQLSVKQAEKIVDQHEKLNPPKAGSYMTQAEYDKKLIEIASRPGLTDDERRRLVRKLERA